jgi:Fe-S-cluster containining protein
MSDQIKLNPDEHKIYLKDKSCKPLRICKALCCRKWDINIAFEEYQQGIYKSEAFCTIDKLPCSKPNKPCPQRSFRLKKKKDGSCVYLDKENHCQIYAMRPIICRNFTCDDGFKIEPICSPSDSMVDDSEFCSFEGGLSLATKFLFNPYFKIKKLSKKKNSIVLTFKDLASCKDKTVELMGLDYFSSKKEIAFLLKQFNGKNTLQAIHKKISKSLSKEAFLNLIVYLIDEKVLIGLFG